MTNNSTQPIFTLSRLVAATLLAASLAACGSGGSGSGSRAPDIGGPGAPNIPGVPGEGGNGDAPGNGGGSGGGNGGGNGGAPVDPRWAPVKVTDPAYNTQTDAVGASAAHAKGVTGAGVTVGVVDSGVYTQNKALDSKSVVLYRMTSDGTRVQVSPDAPLGEQDSHAHQHGTTIAEIIAGKPIATFQGGTAPDASVVAVNVRDADGTIWGNTVHDAIGFLSDQGASIVNASLGGGSGLVPSHRVASLDRAVNNGTLAVFATGNEGAAQPSMDALYPVNFRDAQKGVLAVTGVVANANGQYTDKWSEANACGGAAEWCLSAPARAMVLAPTVTEASGDAPIDIRIGTSNATAIVSGVAALTKSAFPWMDNDNLRQTLLSTATYIADGSEQGGEKFNSTFGWGLVNADKAVRGPSGLHFGEFRANVTHGAYTFSNDIEGAGSLSKDGAGSLTLAGNNTYTGDTSILNGALHVTGINASSHFKVGRGGALSGTGAVRQVTNDGTLVASAEGSLTVNGDFVQTANGVLIPTKGSPLQVGGTADLQGTVDYRNYGYVQGTEHDAIVNASAVHLNGLTATAPVFLTVNHATDGKTLVADITRTSATEVSELVETSSALASAKQLEAAFKVADTLDAKAAAGETLSSDEKRFLSVMAEVQSIENFDDAKAAAARLSGNSYAMMPALMMELQRLDSAAVSDRLSKLNFDSSLPEGPWATFHHVRNKFSPDGYDTAKTDLNGIQIGYDTRMGDWLVGGYASYSDADTHFGGDNGNLDSEKYGFGAYAKRFFGAGYAQVQAGYQHGKAKFDKLTLDGASISANPDTNSFNVGAELGYGFDVGSAKVTPFVGLAYESVRLGDVSESGSTFGMTIGKKTLAETSANVGFRAAWAPTDWSRLGMYYKYDQVLSRKNQDLSAQFMTGGAFTIDAPSYAKGRHTVGLSAQADLGDNTTIGVSYDNRFSSDSKSHTFFVGLKHSF